MLYFTGINYSKNKKVRRLLKLVEKHFCLEVIIRIWGINLFFSVFLVLPVQSEELLLSTDS